MRISYFPYKPGGNPYQKLFSNALENAGLDVLRIPPLKMFPLQRALSHDSDVLQLDWPHDWYQGRSVITRFIKQPMYIDGLRKLKKTPAVWTAHNLYAHDAKNIDYEKKMIQKLINSVSGISVMSESARRALLEVYSVPESTVVKKIPHGHYIDIYPNKIDRNQARELLGIEVGRKAALFFGRILPYKGIEDLIKAFSKISVSGSVLLIAGSCPSSRYQRYISELCVANSSKNAEIRFIPKFIVDEEMQIYFNAADFVALPFKNILNSGTLMLAMSFGKTVLSPNLGSIREIVFEDGWVGYRADEDGALEVSLQGALCSCGVTDNTASLIERVSETYSWNKIGMQALEFYREIA